MKSEHTYSIWLALDSKPVNQLKLGHKGGVQQQQGTLCWLLKKPCKGELEVTGLPGVLVLDKTLGKKRPYQFESENA